MSTSTDRYLMGMVENLENLSGNLSVSDNLQGFLSNATLRGTPVELQVADTMLQWKYTDETEWLDLIDLQNILLNNLPQIEGVQLVGNKTFEDLGFTALSSTEVESVLT